MPFNGGTSDWRSDLYSGGRTPYATRVTYSCGLGRKLARYTANATVFDDAQTMECKWDRTWSPPTVGRSIGLAAIDRDLT